jgi:polyhydroxybutyrate depolymerase
MTRDRGAALLLGLLVAAVGCGRADVYPITRDGAGGSEAASAGAATGGADQPSRAGASACPLPPLSAGDTKHSIALDGGPRTYLLHVPPTYDGSRPAPLVLDFHGVGASGETELSSSPYPALLDVDGALMAFPDGLKGPAGTAWNVGPCCVTGVDDLGFVRALVAEVRKLACVDARRVYAVGVLTGGGMAHYLGCHASDVFAAVAPAAFDLLAENVDDCKPARPLSVVAFRNLDDPRVPYAGGASSLVPGLPLTFLGARPTFEKWAELDGCAGAPSPTDANGCSSYTGCSGGTEVVLCSRDGGDAAGDPSIAWPILERHTL